MRINSDWTLHISWLWPDVVFPWSWCGGSLFSYFASCPGSAWFASSSRPWCAWSNRQGPWLPSSRSLSPHLAHSSGIRSWESSSSWAMAWMASLPWWNCTAESSSSSWPPNSTWVPLVAALAAPLRLCRGWRFCRVVIWTCRLFHWRIHR